MKVYIAGSSSPFYRKWADKIRAEFPGIKIGALTDDVDIIIMHTNNFITDGSFQFVSKRIEKDEHKYVIGVTDDNKEGEVLPSGYYVKGLEGAIKFMKKVAPEYLQEYVMDDDEVI